MTTYKGILIHDAPRNPSGIKYFAYPKNGAAILKSDTLNGIRKLITSDLKINNN